MNQKETNDIMEKELKNVELNYDNLIYIFENFVHIFENKSVSIKGKMPQSIQLEIPLLAETESISINSDKKFEIIEITKTNPVFDEELKKNIGKKVTYGKDKAILVDVQPNQMVVLKTHKGFISVPSSYGSFLYLPSQIKTEPELNVLSNAQEGIHKLSISYLATGFSSSAIYSLKLKNDLAELEGHFMITNNLKDFKKSKICIISGRINKITYGYYGSGTTNQYALQNNNAQNYAPAGLRRTNEGDADMAYENFDQAATEEYRSFSLSDRLVDLKKGQSSKVKFFHKDKVKFERKYVLPIQRQNYGQSVKRSANVVIIIKNSKENGLGFPLPNGLFKVYGDKGIFAGESYVNPTPSGSEAKILIGSAFDIVFDVKNLSHRVDSAKMDISEYEIKVRNSKSTDEEILIELPLLYYYYNYGYQIKSDELKFDQISGQLLRAKTKIKSKEEKTFRFEITERISY